ncbi:hypothetical protein BDY19DRAFT_998451 [Irpex rosettiformis]|uniref:Uncharacterized protein n=1 Tax=Irpex rosettiformis TaxID=378272 RepID=A0ACB8TNL3_9APHY|nr:hypothetical protein BDY19DRAFT_998451 [Irpex rosettiformis]
MSMLSPSTPYFIQPVIAFDTVVIASRTISIFADALVLILTCVKTLRTYLMAREVRLTQKNSISELLVRQGIVYFLIFLSLNVAQTAVQETTGIEYLSPYIFAVTSILMTRFMLNLRKVDDQPSYSLSSALDDVTFEHPQSYPVGESGEVDRETMFCEPSRRTPGFMEGMDADLEFTEMEAEESSLVD